MEIKYTMCFTVIETKQQPFWWGELEDREDLDGKEQWFRQDGTSPDTANVTMSWLREKLEERL